MKMQKWRRIGTFVIDNAVVSMFYQIIAVFFSFYIYFTLSNIIIDMFVLIFYIVLYIAVAMLYNFLSYKYAKWPLGKMILRVHVLGNDGQRLSTKMYMKREFLKYYLMFLTLFLYYFYSIYLVIFKNKQSYHEKKTNSYIYYG